MAFHKISDDNQIEQAFFQLAYAQLTDKLKNLIPNLIGFEIISKEDDGSKALGVFGFRGNGKQTLFVPVFFVNGSIKGMDLIYSKNNDQFYPLNEDFAQALLQEEINSVGQPSKENRSTIQQDNSGFDVRNMAVPPRTGKTSYASCNDQTVDLLTYVKDSNNQTKQAFHSLLKQSSDFTESVLRFYPIEKVAEAVVPAVGKEYRKDNEVKILNTGETFDSKSLDSIQKEELNTQGFIIVDKRDNKKKSKFSPVNLTVKFTNPEKTGFYPYLTETGGINYGLILVKPLQLQLPYTLDDSITIDLDPDNGGQAYITDTRGVFAKDQIVVADYSDVYKKFENPADVKPSFSDTYVLINENLIASQPFKIIANFKDDSGNRRIKVETYNLWETPKDDLGRSRDHGPLGRPGSMHNLPQGNFYAQPKKQNDYFLIFTKIISNKFTRKNENVYIPAGFKLLKVDLTPKSGDVEKYLKAKPGGICSLDAALCERHVYPMTVRNNGSEYFASVKEFKKNYKSDKMAKIGMVTDLGLDWKEACELINSLESSSGKNTKVSGYLKVADLGSYPAQPIEEQPYINEFGQPTYEGVGTINQAPIEHSNQNDPTRMGLGVRPDIEGIDHDIEQASTMAQGGQKSIFDTQTIATLAKYVNPSDKINEYLPTFLSAIDELGRLIFLTHGEIEKFQELYGKADLPKFVELITDVFKNLGELVIFLKRKSPDISINSGNKDALDV